MAIFPENLRECEYPVLIIQKSYYLDYSSLSRISHSGWSTICRVGGGGGGRSKSLNASRRVVGEQTRLWALHRAPDLSRGESGLTLTTTISETSTMFPQLDFEIRPGEGLGRFELGKLL